MPTMTKNQVHRLERAQRDIERVLSELDTDGGNGKDAPEAKWIAEYRRMWLFLKALKDAGGRAGKAEISKLLQDNAYKPQALGGFFNGDPTLAKDGDDYVLTEAGERYIRRWEADFGTA